LILQFLYAYLNDHVMAPSVAAVII